MPLPPGALSSTISKPNREALSLGLRSGLGSRVYLETCLCEGALGWRCQSGVRVLLLNPRAWEGEVLDAQEVTGML